MTPARIAELRRAGVLDGPPEADEARVALLDMYARSMRIAERAGGDPDVQLRYAIAFRIRMAHTSEGKALRWAREQARGARR